MPIQIQGAAGPSGSIVLTAGVGIEAAKGLHVLAKPTDHDGLGHYRVSVVTGTMAAGLAAGAQVFQFKWTSATNFAVITSIRSYFQTLTKFTAGTLTDHTSLDAYVARSYALGGGGTTLDLTGNSGKMRTSMASSLAAINVSTTAALTAVTTLDAQPFEQSLESGDTATTTSAIDPQIRRPGLIYQARMDGGEHPLVLAQNEGFVLRNRTVWPAAGTGVYSFLVQWAETTVF